MIATSLKKGDTIGIVVPSNRIRDDQKAILNNFINKINELGFKIKYCDDIFEKDGFWVSSSFPKTRANEINKMFKDDKIKAIWCFQGGDTVNEILDYLDYDLIKSNPKIIIGKSDIDVLLLTINKLTGLITFHGCDAKLGQDKEFDFKYTQKYFIERFVNKNQNIEPAYEWKCMRKGVAEGKIIGCNLISVLKLSGTKYFPDFKDSIYFMEGYQPDIRKLIAQLTQLKMLDVFNKIKGIVIGHIHNPNAQWKKDLNYEDVVTQLTKEFNFPILKIEEFGHYCPHAFLPIGAKVKLDATNKKIEIIEEFLK